MFNSVKTAVTAVKEKLRLSGGDSSEMVPEESDALAAPGQEFTSVVESVLELFRHLFRMHQNPREFDWTIKEEEDTEVSKLLNSIIWRPKDKSGSPKRTSLGVIKISKSKEGQQSEEQRNLVKDTGFEWSNVMEGQQRMCCITIILVEIRRSILSHIKQDILDEKGTRRAKGIVEQIGNLICAKDANFEPYSRIQTRSRYLEKLVMQPQEEQGDEKGNGEKPTGRSTKRKRPKREHSRIKKKRALGKVTEDSDHKMELAMAKKKKREQQRMSTKLKAEDPDQKMENARVYIGDQLSKLSFEELAQTYFNLINFTFVTKASGYTDEQAIAEVLDQQRSRPFQLVDIFRTQLTQNENDENGRGEKLVDLWRELCAKTGRNVVMEASLYAMQIETGLLLKPTQHGNDQLVMTFFKKFVDPIIEDGKVDQIFCWIEHNAWLVFDLNNGLNFNERPQGICYLEGLEDEKVAEANRIFRLLGSVAREGFKHEITIAIAASLRRCGDNDSKLSCLGKLVPIAAWMLLTTGTNSKQARRERLLKIVPELIKGNTASPTLLLQRKEKTEMKEALRTMAFDPSKQTTKALLENINMMMAPEKKGCAVMIKQAVYLEPIVCNKDQKKYTLGNLVASLIRPSTPKGKNVLDCKKKRWQNSSFPLSIAVANDLSRDLNTNEATMAENTERLVAEAEFKNSERLVAEASRVWGLDLDNNHEESSSSSSLAAV